MIKVRLLSVGFFFLLLSSIATAAHQEALLDQVAVPGEALVQLRQPFDGEQIGHCQIAAHYRECGWSLVRGPEGVSTADLLEDLRAHRSVVAVEPNYRIHLYKQSNDTNLSELWGLERVGAFQAWETTTGNRSVVVAVLDSGLHYEHPDLAANAWRNPGEVAGNGLDDDGNGYVDDIFGIDVKDADPDPYDDSGHGTHVAGTIAAVGDNGLGITGVAWQTSLMALRIFSADGFAGIAGALEAYEYVLAMKARGVNVRVINNSWGGRFPSAAMREMICKAGDAGILSVCAAGNESLNNDYEPSYPSNYDCPGVLAVAASGRDDEVPVFASFGRRSVDLAAPGEGILSTYKDGASLAVWSGSSMAAPHVSGAAALLLARSEALSVRQLRALLMNSVDTLPQWEEACASGGRLNVARAMAMLVSGRGFSGEAEPPPPPLAALSRPSPGKPSDGSSHVPSVSADGRWVVFSSEATNLVAEDQNELEDVFLHDRETGAVILVSRTAAGASGNGASTDPRISADGRYVCFASEAADLVAGDGNRAADVFRYERETGAMILVSGNAAGIQANGPSGAPDVSGTGRWVAFHSHGDNLHAADVNGTWDVFVRDLETGGLELTSVATDRLSGFGPSSYPSISGDGNFVAFQSLAFDLVAGDTNEVWDIFLRDRGASSTELISVNSEGEQADLDSQAAAINRDGSVVGFESMAGNLGAERAQGGGEPAVRVHWRDRPKGETHVVGAAGRGEKIFRESFGVALDPSGRWIAFSSGDMETGEFSQIFVQDLASQKVMQLSWNAQGKRADGGSFGPALSELGHVIFSTWAENLAAGDGNLATDVVMVDLADYRADLMISSLESGQEVGDGRVGPFIPQRLSQNVEAAGRAVFHVRLQNTGSRPEAFRLTRAGEPAGWKVDAFELRFGRRLPVHGLNGEGWMTPVLAPGGSVTVQVEISSADPKTGPVLSEVPFWVAGESQGQSIDRVVLAAVRPLSPPGQWTISRNSEGYRARRNSYMPDFSRDGRFTVFASEAGNLTTGDFNETDDVFLYERGATGVICLSKAANGWTGRGRSSRPRMSGDGRFVVFESTANDLVGANSAIPQIFLYSRETAQLRRVSQSIRGVAGNHACEFPAISNDGSVIAFHSYASNLAGGDGNEVADVIVAYGQGNFSAVRRPDGVWGDGDSLAPVLSGNGRFILFNSFAENFSVDDGNLRQDVFLFDRTSGQLDLVSRTPGGSAGSGDSSAVAVSEDGRWVVFNSSSREWMEGEQAFRGGFLLDRQEDELSGLPGTASSMSPDGRWIGLNVRTENDSVQAAVYDRHSDAVGMVSRLWDGSFPENRSGGTIVGVDGRYVAYVAGPVLGGMASQVRMADQASFLPDQMVQRAVFEARFRGRDQFTQAAQAFEFVVSEESPVTAQIRVENRGTHADRFRFVLGGLSSLQWEVIFRLDPEGSVIDLGSTGEWLSPPVPAGESYELQVQMRATGSEIEEQALTVRVESMNDPQQVDWLALLVLLDSDNDLLPDAWERQFFDGSLAVAGLGTDFDGDGVGDREEHIAGTDPTQAASALRFTVIEPVAGAMRLRWETVPGRLYRVERAATVTGPFRTIAEDVELEQGVLEDDGGREQGFYRLSVSIR